MTRIPLPSSRGAQAWGPCAVKGWGWAGPVLGAVLTRDHTASLTPSGPLGM